MSRPKMRIHRSAPPPQPKEIGRLLDAVAVARMLALDEPEHEETRRWVLEHVPHKVRIGHRTVRWMERDVIAWLESRRESA